MLLESIFLYPDELIIDLNPIFLVCLININPNFVITLFSSIRGTISDIVPTQTISKYFKYSSSFNPISIPRACISLNTTPTPANSLNGYVLSFLLLSTTAIALGISFPAS